MEDEAASQKRRNDEEDETNNEDEYDNEDDEDFRLEDEDYDLLEENLGVKVRRRKFKRLRRYEDSDEEEMPVLTPNPRARRPESIMQSDDEENEETVVSDDGFIVDEQDRPISQRIRAAREYTDASVLEAREIFGADFDYGDLATPPEDDESGSEDSEYQCGVLDESDKEEGVPRPRRQKPAVVNLADIYEPAELEKIGITDEAHETQKTDLPERFQNRNFPLTPTGPELNGEVIWIYRTVFENKNGDNRAEADGVAQLSTAASTIAPLDEEWDEDEELSTVTTTSATPVMVRNRLLTKIKKIIKLIRDESFEVPYIFFHKKDLTRPEFSLYDLWKIYDLDEEYCRLYQRRARIMRLFANMKGYQSTLSEEAMLSEFVRPITDEELDHIERVTSIEEIQDLQSQFLLYYADDVPKMKAVIRQKKREIQREQVDGGGEVEETVDENQNRIRSSGGGRGMYRICKQNGIGNMLPLLGLTAEEFGENYEANFVIHFTHQCELTLDEALDGFKTPRWSDTAIVADAAKYMLATQISRDVNVRKAVRAVFFKKAKISVTPTKKGIEVIDENHPVFPMKYLRDKPVEEFDGLDFFDLTLAEKDKLITLSVGENISDRKGLGISLIEEAKELFKAEEEEAHVAAWEEFRGKIIEYAFQKFLYPEFTKEVRNKLFEKGRKLIRQRCADKVYSYLRNGPFKVTFEEDNDDREWDTSNGFRVMGLAFYEDSVVHGAVLDKDGYVIDRVIVSELFTKHMKSMNDGLIEAKEAHMHRLRDIIEKTKPHVIVIGGEGRGAMNLMDDMKAVLLSFSESQLNFRNIHVIIIDNDVSKVFSRTAMSIEEFPDSNEVFRQAVSLGRFLQDPLLELAQLFNLDEDILSLQYYKYQCHISKDELLRDVEVEFVNRTSETGVDINQAIVHKHRSATLQFVPGFGYQKATAFLRYFRKNQRKIQNRSELVVKYDMGSVVFNNCIGFIKINKDFLLDDADIDPRDQTRIHPEYYEHALAVSRAVIEDEDEEGCSASEIVEIVMANPDCQASLEILDLTEYLNELRRSGFGDLKHLFDDIKNELMDPFAEFRKPFQVPDNDELFYILTKETPETIREGKLITAQVTDIKFRPPTDQEFEEAMPTKDNETGKFMCKFCFRLDFPNIEAIFDHYDERMGSCPGKIHALRVHYGNGLSGFIRVENFSDGIPEPRDLVRFASMRPPITARILRLSKEYFFIDCTSKTTDLQNPAFMPKKDPYFDEEAEGEVRMKLLKKYHEQVHVPFVRRNIDHPSFKNFTFEQVVELLKGMEPGEAIFRPSTKGTNHLAMSWKIAPGILQHANVEETNKPNPSALGTCLTIGEHKYEDLDEIIVRHVNTQASFIREILAHKNYTVEDCEEPEVAQRILDKEREKNPDKTNYIISASQKTPGNFIMSFLPLDKVHQETMKLGPQGIHFRSHMYTSISDVIHHWKQTFAKSDYEIPNTDIPPEPVKVKEEGEVAD